MRKSSYSRLVTLIALLAVSSVSGAPQEYSDYVITVGNETLTYVRNPQAGYVLKTRGDIGSMETVSPFLKNAGDVKISPIRGLGRKGVSVVYNERLADENDKTIKSLGVHSDVQYTAPLFSSNGETVAIIPEIVVRVKPGIEIGQVQSICEMAGCTMIKQMEFTEQEYLIEVLGPDAEAVFVAVEELGQNPEVEWASPNTAFRPKLCAQTISGGFAYDERFRSDALIQDANSPGVLPNDEYFPNQWHLHNTGQYGGIPGADINASKAWEITTGDPNIVVAVVDTGVDGKHPDLIGNLVAGYDFIRNDDEPNPELAAELDHHGTWCAGLIAAQGNNSIGVTGVTWNCRIMPIRINDYYADGSSHWVTWADMAEAFRFAASNGADILSNSWISDHYSPVFDSALVDVTEPSGIGRGGKGCVVFFPAGPFGTYPNFQSIRYHSASPEVISVGAIDDNDARLEYSAYGPELNIMAPGAPYPSFVLPWYIPGRSGAPIWTTGISGSMDYFDNFGGTSAATPIAAGVAALILSVDPNLTNEEVRHFLTRSSKDLGDPGRDDYYGWGRVDARAALDMVLTKRADLNNDWKVDMEDLLILIEFWRTDEPSADIAPATKRDGIVDEQDLELLIRYWQKEIPEMDPIDQ